MTLKNSRETLANYSKQLSADVFEPTNPPKAKNGTLAAVIA